LKDTPIMPTPTKNLSHAGSENGNAKLDEKTVLKIRKEYLIVKNIAEMARRYKMSETQMSRIIKRECFKNV
jgi:Mor family transcriptional regulator